MGHNRRLMLLGVTVVAVHFGGGTSADAEPAMVVATSQRMVPVMQKLAEGYAVVRPEVSISIEGSSPSEAITKLERLLVTFAAIDRRVSADEIRRFRRIRRVNLVSIPLAMDAIVFFVRPDNPVKSLTVDQVSQIFTHKVSDWEDLGVPIEGSIRRHVLFEDSGMARVLQSLAMHGKAFTTATTEYSTTPEVVKGVAGDLVGVGFGGMGYSSGVKVLALQKDDQSPPVVPTVEAVRQRAYPLAHYVYLVFVGQPRDQAKDFLTFCVSPKGQTIVQESQTNLIPLPLRGFGD